MNSLKQFQSCFSVVSIFFTCYRGIRNDNTLYKFNLIITLLTNLLLLTLCRPLLLYMYGYKASCARPG